MSSRDEICFFSSSERSPGPLTMVLPTKRVGSDSRRIVKSWGASAINQLIGDPNIRQIRESFSLLAARCCLNVFESHDSVASVGYWDITPSLSALCLLN